MISLHLQLAFVAGRMHYSLILSRLHSRTPRLLPTKLSSQFKLQRAISCQKQDLTFVCTEIQSPPEPTVLPNKMPTKVFAQQEISCSDDQSSEAAESFPCWLTQTVTRQIQCTSSTRRKSQDAATCQQGRKHAFWLLRAHKTSYPKTTLFQK